MKVVILAGGRGVRLAPYTTVFPKPLVPLGHKPILEIIIRQLVHYGFKDIVLSVGYLSELIRAYCENVDLGDPEVKIDYAQEINALGTAGPLRLIEGLDETFMVMNGDVLTTLDYHKLLDYHRQQNACLTIALHRRKIKIDLGVIHLTDDGQIDEYIEKPEHECLVSMGVYVYEPEVLEYIKPGEYLDFPDLVQNLLKDGKKVAGFHSDAFWLDIGRHDDYALAQEEYEKIQHLLMPGN